MKQKTGKYLLSFLLTLAMVVGLVPGMGLTALAYDDDPYASLVGTTTTVKFNDIDWYIIADNSTAVDDGTVTLLAKDPIGASKFNNSTDNGNAYSNSEVKKYLDSLTATGGSFKTVADAITPVTLTIYKYDSTTEVAETIQNAKLWLLSTSEANALTEGVRKCSQASGAQYNYWWLRSPGSGNKAAACVLGAGGVNDPGFIVTYTLGVRPTLKLNLSSVIFSSVNLSGGANATISEGTATQNYFDVGNTRGAMTTVTYTAKTGYKFPETSELYKETNGITVTRTSDTVITVSGTPTADASITIPDAVLAHTHSFTYSVDGATITATCTADGCTLPESSAGAGNHVATLTISANGGTYDGTTAYGATITDANSIQGDAKVQYQKKTDGSYGTATETAPTDAGEYKASITVGGATASVEYTIAQKEVTVSGITASDKVYDGNTDVTLVTTAATVTGKLNDDALTVSATGTFDNANVGENKTVTISNLTLDGASKDNYKLASAGSQTTTTAKITAKEVGLTWSNTELAYTGEAQKPTATATGVVDGDTCTVTVAGEQTNVGDNYTATAESLSNSNYKLPENKTTTFKIVKGNAVPATITANNRTYDGTEKPLVTVTGEVTGGEMRYALGENATTAPAENLYTTSIPAKTEAGTYYVWFKVVGDANHNDSTPDEVSVCIGYDRASATAPTARNLTYTGETQELVTAGTAEGGELVYAIGTDAATAPTDGYTATVPTAADAGTYYVWYMVVGDENHIDTTPACITVTIGNAAVEEKEGLTLDEDGTIRYYTDSVFDPDYVGTAPYAGGLFLVKDGFIYEEANGLVEWPTGSDDWYWTSNGQVHTEYTGLVQMQGTNAWFFVTNGKLDRTKEGRVAYDGSYFIVSAGQLHKEYTGLWQDPETGSWAYYDHGQFWPSFSGVTEYNGGLFLVSGGLIDSAYAGEMEYNGTVYTVVSGQLYNLG